jgi:circadian clock protein KaiC
VYPRSESIFQPVDVGLKEARVESGLPELDRMMGGGPRMGSITFLAGALGTGKTLTGLHFLMAGVSHGESGVFVGFRESPRQLMDKARGFGLDLEGAIASGRVTLIYRAPVDLVADEIAWEIRRELLRLKPARLIIDNFSVLERSVPEEAERHGFFAALAGTLEGLEVTSLLTREISQFVGPELDFSDTPLAALAENLVLLRWVEYRSEIFRIISILKMRDSPYDASIRQYTIDERGFRILEPLETAEGLLTGIARLPAEARRKPRGS